MHTAVFFMKKLLHSAGGTVERYEQQLSSDHENRTRTLFMAVSTDAAVLLSVLTANPGRNNRSENMNTVHTAITL